VQGDQPVADFAVDLEVAHELHASMLQKKRAPEGARLKCC